MRYFSIFAILFMSMGLGSTVFADGLKLGLLSEFNYTDDSRGPSDLDLQRGRLWASTNLSDEFTANVTVDFTKNATGGFDSEVSRAYLTRNLNMPVLDRVTIGKFKSKMGYFTTQEAFDRNTVSAPHQATLYDSVRTGVEVGGHLSFVDFSLNVLDHETIGSSYGGDLSTTVGDILTLGVSASHSRDPNLTTVAYYTTASVVGFDVVGEILSDDSQTATVHPYAVDVSRDLCDTVNVGIRYSAFLSENDSDAYNITPHFTYAPLASVKLNVEYDHNDFSRNTASDFQVVRAYLGFNLVN
jgi:hypothetical protein